MNENEWNSSESMPAPAPQETATYLNGQPLSGEPVSGSAEPAGSAGEAPLPVQQVPQGDPSAVPAEEPIRENIAAGAVGALLFALGGGVVIFLLLQINLVASVGGWIAYVLAQLGYGIFAGTKRKVTIPCIICSVAATLLVIFFAEYASFGYAIYDVYKEDYGISFFDALRSVPEFLTEADLRNDFIRGIALSVMFSAIPVVGSIINRRKK